MISSIQHLPLVRQESFLRAKYESEGLSVNKIAELTFSSRSTVVKYLDAFGIHIRGTDRKLGPLPFGMRRRLGKVVLNERERTAIEIARRLRAEGLSYGKVAAAMNAMGIRTRTGKAAWYAKTVRDILVRDS